MHCDDRSHAGGGLCHAASAKLIAWTGSQSSRLELPIWGRGQIQTDGFLVEIDGKPVAKPYGPIELAPGPHSVTMKCGDSTKTSSVTVGGGECMNLPLLLRRCPGMRRVSIPGAFSRPIRHESCREDAQAARARSEFDEAVKRAKEERVKSAPCQVGSSGAAGTRKIGADRGRFVTDA